MTNTKEIISKLKEVRDEKGRLGKLVVRQEQHDNGSYMPCRRQRDHRSCRLSVHAGLHDPR